MISDGDKERDIVIEIVNVCDSEHSLSVKCTIFPDGLDECGIGEFRKESNTQERF